MKISWERILDIFKEKGIEGVKDYLDKIIDGNSDATEARKLLESIKDGELDIEKVFNGRSDSTIKDLVESVIRKGLNFNDLKNIFSEDGMQTVFDWLSKDENIHYTEKLKVEKLKDL